MSRALYVVLAHDNAARVERLAQAILHSSPDAAVLVAWDDRGSVALPAPSDPRVEVFSHGRASDWGSWELVEATLDALRLAQTRHDPDIVTVVSGDDYPVKRLDLWEDEVLAGASWVGEAAPIAYRPRWGRRQGVGDDRWTRYGYRWFRAPWSRWASRAPEWWWRAQTAIALRVEPVFGVRMVTRGRGLHYGFRRLRSPFTEARPCYYGSQWFAVTRSSLRWLLEDLSEESTLRRVFHGTVIPDESAIVTALAWRSPIGAYPPVTHVKWDAAADRPIVWTEGDLSELLASGSPFCRKVSNPASDSLLDKLDRLSRR